MGKSTFESLFSTNEDGVEIYMGVNAKGEDIYFTIAETNNPAHLKAQRKYEKAMSMARKNPEKQHHILSKMMAETIVHDWRGVLDDNGKELPCTIENMTEAFSKYKKLFYAVVDEASNEDNFRDIEDPSDAEVQKDTEKNSKKS